MIYFSFVGEAIKSWHDSLERYSGENKVDKVLMTSYLFARELTEKNNPKLLQALEYIKLLDATLDLGDMDKLNETTQEVCLTNSKTLNFRFNCFGHLKIEVCPF